MKQLTCEMCGSIDLIKQDGIFVCQVCKTKYSAEEAKKMMMGDEAEHLPSVTGAPVQTVEEKQSPTLLTNLLQLAQSSYDAKNYEQAENFCNQALTMDATCFTAWKIKGQAIDAQISASNDRIDEVCHCLRTAYNVLSDSGKDEHREEITELLRKCLESEIDFALDIFRNERPSGASTGKVMDAFVNCIESLEKAHIELGHTEESAHEYTISLKNTYLSRINDRCRNSWRNQVYYNYYRHGWNSEFHPTRDIMKDFIDESSALMVLLQLLTAHFSDKTPVAVKIENYKLQKLIASTVVNAQSFKLMEYTTTNEYGAVISQRTKWEPDHTLSDSSKAFWNQTADQADVAITKADPKERERMIRQWTSERDSISRVFKPDSGHLVGTILGSIVAFIAFVFLPDLDLFRGWDTFTLVIGLIFSLIAIIALCFAINAGKKTHEQNIERINQLNKKIKEASESATPAQSGEASTPIPGNIAMPPRALASNEWACSQCGAHNNINYGICKKCGTYRTRSN